MTALVYVVIALGVVVLAAAMLWKPVRNYFARRGDRVVACPENNETVAVSLTASAAAFGSGGDLRLESCTRWPEKAGCGQECLREIEASPDGCLVRTRVRSWYQEKSCVYCGKPLGAVDWTERKPAVLDPAGRTHEWRDVKPEALPAVLATHKPVCWDCHVAETFRRVRPDLVIDNPGASGTVH